MAKLRKLPASWLLVPFVLLFFFLAVDSMVDDSPTMDEQNHIGRGIAFVKTGDPRLSLEHPPLVNAISALPLLLMRDLKVPFDDPSWVSQQPPDVYWYVFADELMWQLGNDVTQMMFLARLPVLFMTLGLALVGFHWARQLWRSPFAPHLTFLFILFDPNILANGRYVTTDLGGTLFIFLATFLLWRMWKRPSWRTWLLAGVGMGLAFGSKLSALAFVPIWGVMALLPLYRRNRTQINTDEHRCFSDFFAPSALSAVKNRLGMYVSAGLFSIVVVWAIFGFEWGRFAFKADWLVGLNQVSGPMPTFWRGIEKILFWSSSGRMAYLLGDFSLEGFIQYFPVAFAVKTPLVTLIGLLAGVVLLLWRRETRQRVLFVLLVPLLYFATSMTSNLNIGYRHLLPTLPFVYLIVSGLVAWGMDAKQRRIMTVGVSGAFMALLLTTVWIHPHYLSFFNQAAGGPENGYRILLDSNVDWGQDLLRLQDWMVEEGVERVKLGWFGAAIPDYYGISYEPLPGSQLPAFYSQWTVPPFNVSAPEPGVYAISVSNLMELPLPNSTVYGWFRQQEPDARIGYSILIYRVG